MKNLNKSSSAVSMSAKEKVDLFDQLFSARSVSDVTNIVNDAIGAGEEIVKDLNFQNTIDAPTNAEKLYQDIKELLVTVKQIEALTEGITDITALLDQSILTGNVKDILNQLENFSFSGLELLPLINNVSTMGTEKIGGILTNILEETRNGEANSTALRSTTPAETENLIPAILDSIDRILTTLIHIAPGIGIELPTFINNKLEASKLITGKSNPDAENMDLIVGAGILFETLATKSGFNKQLQGVQHFFQQFEGTDEKIGNMFRTYFNAATTLATNLLNLISIIQNNSIIDSSKANWLKNNIPSTLKNNLHEESLVDEMDTVIGTVTYDEIVLQLATKTFTNLLETISSAIEFFHGAINDWLDVAPLKVDGNAGASAGAEVTAGISIFSASDTFKAIINTFVDLVKLVIEQIVRGTNFMTENLTVLNDRIYRLINIHQLPFQDK